MAYNPRLTCPERTNKYYNSNINPFVSAGYGMFQNNGNCTCYAYGRFMEVLNQDSCRLSTGNAEDFYLKTSDGYKRGQTPKLGAIICWEGVGSKAGHVAVVEKINSDGSILTSNSAWQGGLFYTKTLYPPYNMGSGYKFQGFIYNPKAEDGIRYRAHIQGPGWLPWVSDGETAGTTGKSTRLEAIQIDAPFDVYAKAHCQGDNGWRDYGKITKDTVIGTTGQKKRLECIQLKGKFNYRVHIQGTGWTCWTYADGICTLGSVGQSLRIEAIQIKERK